MLPLVDAVTMALPTSLHYQSLEKYIKSGVHLLVEKPLAETFEAENSVGQICIYKISSGTY